MLKVSKDLIRGLFGKRHAQFRGCIETALSDSPELFRDVNGGHLFKFAVCNDAVSFQEVLPSCGGSTRLAFYFLNLSERDAMGCSDLFADLRLDVPTQLVLAKGKPNFWLYNIRFAMDEKRVPIDDLGMMPFKIGYYGITKRTIFERFKEHRAKVENGTGHILHKAWRGLLETGISCYPVLQVSGTATSLKDIYDKEETAVATMSLAPKGLNAIPGGYAGIKMLHELALLSSRQYVLPEERDAALDRLERSAGIGKATHYRSGHVRNLPGGRTTWVSPCWVNLSREVSA